MYILTLRLVWPSCSKCDLAQRRGGCVMSKVHSSSAIWIHHRCASARGGGKKTNNSSSCPPLNPSLSGQAPPCLMATNQLSVGHILFNTATSCLIIRPFLNAAERRSLPGYSSLRGVEKLTLAIIPGGDPDLSKNLQVTQNDRLIQCVLYLLTSREDTTRHTHTHTHIPPRS
jgi:hypothetical protein